MSFPLPYFSCRIPQIATPTVAKAACLSFRLEVHAERSVLRRSTHHHQWPNPHAIPFRGWNSTRTRGLPGGTPSWPKPHNLKSTRIRGGTTGDSRIRCSCSQQLPLGGWYDDYPGDRLSVLTAKCLSVLMANSLAYRS